MRSESVRDMLKNLSAQDFLNIGMHQIAYIKPAKSEEKESYTIHAADGTPISAAESYNSALASLHTHELEAVTLH